MSKKAITEKEETFEALKTLMFYHHVYVELSFKDKPELFTVKVGLKESFFPRLLDKDIAEVRISFKPNFDD